MSSSHLLLGLPIALLVLYFDMSSGFHSVAFINHLSLRYRCYSQSQSPFHFYMSLVLTSNLRIFHLFHGFVCASFLCSQSNLLLQSLWCRFLRRYLFRKRCRCPDRCVRLSFVHLHFHLQCCPNHQCLFSPSFRFTIFLYLLFVCVMRILRCVD